MTTPAFYNLTASDGTTPLCGLGDFADIAGAKYQYLIADGAIAAYALCHLQNDFDAAESTRTLVTATKPTAFCIPQFAVADNEYFWAPVGPFFKREDGTTFKVLAANAALNVRLYATATAGVVDDAVVTDNLISGLYLTETVTTQEAADCLAVGKLGSALDTA